jgi:hypothetical protein
VASHHGPISLFEHDLRANAFSRLLAKGKPGSTLRNAALRVRTMLWGKQVNDYDALRDYLAKRKLPELVLSFEQIEEIIGAALPRAAQRASWWETLRSPQEKMPQREACLAAGYIAIRLPGGRGVRFRRMPSRRPGERREP